MKRASTIPSEQRRTARLRVKPLTMARLRAYAESSGFDRNWSLALEAILGGALGALKKQALGTHRTLATAERGLNESYSAKLSPSLMMAYRLQAVRLGYARYSDLLTEVLERFLTSWLRGRGRKAWTVWINSAVLAELQSQAKKGSTWESGFEKILKQELRSVTKRPTAKQPLPREKRERDEALGHAIEVDQGLLVSYHEEATRLGYERASDLYGEVLARFFELDLESNKHETPSTSKGGSR